MSRAQEFSKVGEKLGLFPSDMLLLVETVADHSGNAELVEKSELFSEYSEKIRTSEPPSLEKIKADASVTVEEVLERALDRKNRSEFEMQLRKDGKVDLIEAEHPNLRPSRKVLSRREMLSSLLKADLHPQDLREEEAPENREISEAYFEAVATEALNSDLGLMSLISYDGKEYFYFQPLLSSSYARLLSSKDNPKVQICEQVRENSRLYPRPFPLSMFLGEPFHYEPEKLEQWLHEIAQKEDCRDIRFTQSSLGTIFLYSNQYLDDDYAEFLAEQNDVTVRFNP